jgi:hypothetical protein
MKIIEEEEINMITSYRINRIENYELVSFLKDIGCSDMQFKLLCFWGRHPRSSLSLYTVARALNTVKINLRYAIRALVEKGILTERSDSNGLTTFALSGSQRIQEYIGCLAKLDWGELTNLRKELKEQSGLSAIGDEIVPPNLPE